MKLPKTAKRIKNSKDYIDIDGTVYTHRSHYKGKDNLVVKAQRIIKGYKYCGIYDNETKRCKGRRVHRVVAETFIPNPKGLPLVGHKNNIKSDNRVENLYWTTNQENIQKAHDDGLCPQDKGIDDSQSKPVVMYNTLTNEIIGEFGSICEAVRETGLSKTTVSRQAKYHRPVRKSYFFRYKDDEVANQNSIIGMFDYNTDRLLKTFYSIANASKETGICEKTISEQVKKGKPKLKYSNQYFKQLTSKCEQTIES